jgi:hypothetical protein
MSMDDEFRDPDVIQQVEILAMEFEEAFVHIRRYTKSDICAWFVVDAFLDRKRIERMQAQRKRKGDRPVSEAQLKELASLEIESLADLSRKEAQVLIDRFDCKGQEKDQEEEEGGTGWY